ncbi:integrating conjugative element protein [Pseudomonas protegens]|uniref:Integrating conjugative element protein n=1 Tax=Pseudomonas protegens TaxID=380021 RepID=A0A2T6GD45_9PSED|nr:integrating conjugative element protein [Pseudomonas protegens]PUA42062.1 integrating conjugative element protein [Pseudomonas protegens]
MKPHLWTFALLCCIGNALAAGPIGYDKSGSVIGDDVLYSIGGGNAVTMGSAGNMDSLGVGVGWNNNLVCGNMSLNNTLQNQLNGATQGFQNIMSSVVQNATSAVASLPALILQRANPQLYNLITNGILQARLDFDRSKGTCRAIADKMTDIASEQMGWGKLAEGQAMSKTLGNRNTDAVKAVDQMEKTGGNEGVTWVGGQRAGGSGQKPIRLVGDVTKAGYNLLNKRSVDDTSAISRTTCNNGMVCNQWSSPQEAVAFATRVLGEQQQQTCDNCQKTVTAAGVGLTPLIQETYETKLKALEALLAGRKGLTDENLALASSNALPITRGVINALHDESDQQVLAQRLASEVAVSDVLEKALVLQRTLLAGSKEPNVAANGLAQQAIGQQNGALQMEIDNLKTELELRRQFASNSPMTIIARKQGRAEDSRGVYQGDTEQDRLDKLQAPDKPKQ